MVKLLTVKKDYHVFKKLCHEEQKKELFYEKDLNLYDFIVYKETKNNKETGKESYYKVITCDVFEDNDGFLYKLELQNKVPSSFELFCSLTDKEQFVVKEVFSHMYLYGLGQRAIANTIWDIIHYLFDNVELSDEDIKWYNDLFFEIADNIV